MTVGMDQRAKIESYLQSRRAEFGSRYGIESIRIFGSRARGDHRPESDVDLLITAARPYRFDLIGLIALEQEISENLGLPVDVILEEDLKPSIRSHALADAISI